MWGGPRTHFGAWEKGLLGCLGVLHILKAEALTAFVLGYLIKGVCTVNNLRKWNQCLPPEHKEIFP